MTEHSNGAHADLIAEAESRRAQVVAHAEAQRANPPLKFFRQQAHFTTPASDYGMVQKAVEGGCSAVPRILSRFGISNPELAETLGIPESEIEALLNAGDGQQAPLVMVDGEDAQALRADVVARGRENAVRIFKEANWGRTLRFYRPSGLNLPYGAGDLVHVLTGVAEGWDGNPATYPVEGIIFPKSEHPDDVGWACDTLAAIEQRLGLPDNHIKFQFLVESGWAVINLPELARRALPRLVGIIFGIADYSADIKLPKITFDDPVCDWARMVVVNVAGAVGVPAIDAMTVNYPVADPNLGPEQNKLRILSRLKEVYDDTWHGIKLGMDGKWVGHPAQLFAVLLAYRMAQRDDQLQERLAEIEEYTAAVERELGATIIKGVMSDRATDRHARNLLREALAQRRLPAEKGVALGLITPDEAKQLA